MQTKLSPANIVILAGGVAMLVGSFLGFYKFTLVDPFSGASHSFSVNAWDRGLFLITTLPAFLGMFMAVQVGLVAFGNISMPPRVLGLTWDQFHVVLALQAAVLMFTLLVRARPTLVSFDIGFWCMVAAAIALVTGAFMRLAATGRRPHSI